MQALGVAVELSPTSVSSCIEQTRLGFMYAPYYHPVMKSVKAVRSALQVWPAATLTLKPCLHCSAADMTCSRQACVLPEWPGCPSCGCAVGADETTGYMTVCSLTSFEAF